MSAFSQDSLGRYVHESSWPPQATTTPSHSLLVGALASAQLGCEFRRLRPVTRRQHTVLMQPTMLTQCYLTPRKLSLMILLRGMHACMQQDTGCQGAPRTARPARARARPRPAAWQAAARPTARPPGRPAPARAPLPAPGRLSLSALQTSTARHGDATHCPPATRLVRSQAVSAAEHTYKGLRPRQLR